MRYISTRGKAPRLGFEETMLAGLAEDGGLYLPEIWPTVSREDLAALAGKPYSEIAYSVVKPFTGGAFSEDELRSMAHDAYERFGHEAKCPLVQIGTDLFLLELFHGPTLAFKDFAMQFVGRMFETVLRRRGKRITIIGATSGDTGSAAIEAFRGSEFVNAFILYPHGRVSEIQRRQMTTPDDANVHAIAVDGHFDDCQALVKDMFNDADFRSEMRLSGVNSINWARIVAQIVYYFASALALGSPERKVVFTVPTGNFGDVFAGYAAKLMGLPVDRLVVATNQNDILHRALESGEYRKSAVLESISPSMDIQVSSNFERALFEAEGRDAPSVYEYMDSLKSGGFTVSENALSRIKETFGSGRCSETETFSAIRSVYEETGEVVCPHTAVGVKVAKELERKPGVPVVALATAHPAKFPDAVEQASGVHVELPKRMANIREKPERVLHMANNLEELKSAIKERCST